jgi:8-oxo-dGTP diphosphatase
MTEKLIPEIRNAVRAVIIRDGDVLLQRKVDENGFEHFTLPGGAQELGETLAEALLRECREEVGADIEVIDLLCVCDYFKSRLTSPPSTRHVLELLFRCTIDNDYTAQNGPRPDRHQVDVLWAPINSLDAIGLVPADYAVLVARAVDNPVYVGRVS